MGVKEFREATLLGIKNSSNNSRTYGYYEPEGGTCLIGAAILGWAYSRGVNPRHILLYGEHPRDFLASKFNLSADELRRAEKFYVRKNILGKCSREKALDKFFPEPGRPLLPTFTQRLLTKIPTYQKLMSRIMNSIKVRRSHEDQGVS